MSLKVEYKTLSGTDATNRYISLSSTPSDATVAMDIISGTAQAYLTDFIVVDTTKVSWNGLSLDSTLVTGDELRIIYDRT